MPSFGFLQLIFLLLLWPCPVEGTSYASFNFATALVLVGTIACVLSCICAFTCILARLCRVQCRQHAGQGQPGSARSQHSLNGNQRPSHSIHLPASRNAGRLERDDGETVGLPSYLAVMRNLNKFEEISPNDASILASNCQLPLHPSCDHELPSYSTHSFDPAPAYGSEELDLAVAVTLSEDSRVQPEESAIHTSNQQSQSFQDTMISQACNQESHLSGDVNQNEPEIEIHVSQHHQLPNSGNADSNEDDSCGTA